MVCYECLDCDKIYQKRSYKRYVIPNHIEKGHKVVEIETNMYRLNRSDEYVEDLKQSNQLLRMDVNMLKRMYKELKGKLSNGTFTSVDPIKRIKQDNHRPERDKNTVNMVVIVKELKVMFKTEDDKPFDYHTVLKPINPIEEPVSPPEIVGVNIINPPEIF